MEGNTFEKLNYIKNLKTDKEITRRQSAVARTQSIQMRNLGLVLDVYGGTRKVQTILLRNTFKDSQFYLYKNMTVNPDYCDMTLNTPDEIRYTLYYNDSQNYVQFTHLINIRQINDSQVIIAGNTFTNLSMPGPLIYFEERIFNTSASLILFENNFTLIHGYVGTNILQVKRTLPYNILQYFNLTYSIAEFERLLFPKYSKFGGGVTIENNYFQDIIGCQGVDASIFSMAVFNDTYTVTQPYLKLLNLPSNQDDALQNPLFLNNQPTSMILSLVESIKNINESSLFQYSENRTLTVNNYITQFKGNQYNSCFMGTGTTVNGRLLAGGLIKFMNVFLVDFVNENFTNIGGMTQEELANQIYKIFRTPTHFEQDKTLIYNKWGVLNMRTPPNQLPFFYNNISQGLIIGHTMIRLRFLGSNIFNNIWLTDRLQAYFRYNIFFQNFEKGLILKLTRFIGFLQIGGPPQGQESTGDTQFINLQGFLNDYTIQRYKAWNPQNYSSIMKTQIKQQDQEYGLGSVLFHIHDDSNFFGELTIQNTVFKNIVARPQSFGGELPVIFGVASLKFFTRTNLTIKSVLIQNCTFERGMGFMALFGDNITLQNLTVNNIGTQNLYKPPLFAGFENTTFPFSSYSFFNVSLTIKQFLTTSQPVVSTFLIKDCAFSNFVDQHGLPLFTIQVFDLQALAVSQLIPNLINNVTIFNSTFANTNKLLNNSIPLAILFKETSYPSQLVKFNITKCTFKNLTSQNGLFTIGIFIHSITFDNCFFDRLSGQQAQVIFLEKNRTKGFSVLNSVVQGTAEPIDDIRETILSQNLAQFANTSAFVITESQNITISGTKVKNFNYVNTGAFINIKVASSVIIDNSYFEDLSAKVGGAISITSQSNLTITNSVFQKISAYQAGVIMASDSSNIFIEDSMFKKNFAYKYGVFKIIGSTFFNITNTEFLSNQAEQSHSIGQINEAANMSSFINSKFIENQASYTKQSIGQKGLEAISCEYTIYISGCLFDDNIAQISTPNLCFIGASNVVIEDTTFQNSYTYKAANSYSGNFMQVISQSVVTIRNSQFRNGRADVGGAIYLMGGPHLNIEQTTFTNNVASQQGGAISADNIQTVSITKNTVFKNNRASQGDSLYFKNVDDSLVLKNSVFSSDYSYSNFLDLQQITEVQISQCDFRISSNPKLLDDTRSVGLLFSEIQQLTVSETNFVNLKGNSLEGGGAMRIVETQVSKQKTNSFNIRNCNFEYSQGINGGALSLVNVINVMITNTTFKQNQASESGGAIYFNCESIDDPSQCSLLIKDSQFTQNYAGVDGGVIKWNRFEPSFDNATYQNNSAQYYGNKIASITTRLVQITKEIADQNEKKAPIQKRMLLEKANGNYSIQNAQSGGTFQFFFALIDKDYQIVRTSNHSKLYINLEQLDEGVPPLVETQTQFISSNGVFNVENLVFVGEPNSKQKIAFTTDGITKNLQNIDSNAKVDSVNVDPQSSNQSSSTNNQTIAIILSLRPCIDGEERLPSGKCQKCKENYYLLEAPKTTQLCKLCPSGNEAECLGGNQVYPKPGYWRATKYSETFFKCRNSEACIGRNYSDVENLRGACNLGYQGVLCTDCQIGYSRIGSEYKCLKCPSKEDNGFRLFGVLLVFVVVIIIIIRSNLQSSRASKINYLPAFIRILMNHFQFLILIAQFDLEWPQLLQQFFQVFRPVSDVTTQYLSVDCFLDKRVKVSLNFTDDYSTLYPPQDDKYRVFFQKVIILAIVPIAIAIVVILVWQPIFLVQYILKAYKQRRLSQSLAISPQELESSMTNLNNNNQFKSNQESQSEKDLTTLKEEVNFKDSRIISSIIIICFLFHPTVTSQMFSAFNCQTIDGSKRLFEDLEIECYSGSHKFISFYVALPGLLLWGLGIPAFGFLFIFRNRKNLQTVEVRSKYGFLYNGYRYPEAHYWEVVILYRKIIIIFIQVFLAQQGKIVQAMIMLVFLTIFITLTLTQRPFANRFLNNLEALSLISSAITVYCGLFYISHTSFKEDKNFSFDERAKTTLFSIIVSCHAVFFFYWIQHFLMEIRSSIRQQFPTIYLALFHCCKRNKLYEENQIESFKEKLEPYLKTIHRTKKYLLQRENLYLNGELPFEDESLKKLLITCEQYLNRFDKLVEFSKKDQNDSVKIETFVKKQLSESEYQSKHSEQSKKKQRKGLFSPQEKEKKIKDLKREFESDRNQLDNDDFIEEEQSESDNQYGDTGILNRESKDSKSPKKPSKYYKGGGGQLNQKHNLKPVKEKDEFDSFEDKDNMTSLKAKTPQGKSIQQRHRDLLRKAISVTTSMGNKPLKQLTITTTPLVEEDQKEELESLSNNRNPHKMATLNERDKSHAIDNFFIDYLQKAVPQPRRRTHQVSTFGKSVTPVIPSYKMSERSSLSQGSNNQSQSVQSGIQSPIIAPNKRALKDDKKSSKSSRSNQRRLIADFVLRNEKANIDQARQQNKFSEFQPPVKNVRRSVAQQKKQKEKFRYFNEVMEKGVISNKRRQSKNPASNFLTVEDQSSQNVEALRLDRSYSQASIRQDRQVSVENMSEDEDVQINKQQQHENPLNQIEFITHDDHTNNNEDTSRIGDQLFGQSFPSQEPELQIMHGLPELANQRQHFNKEAFVDIQVPLSP